MNNNSQYSRKIDYKKWKFSKLNNPYFKLKRKSNNPNLIYINDND